MKKFKVEVTELLQRVVEVEACSKREAMERVAEQYYQELIVLDDTDLVNRAFNVLED